MIKELYIKKFRAMEDFNIPLAPVLTAIAGHNATGKSTLLGIIGNTFQLPAKNGKTILGKTFKTEFSEILNGSKEKDSTGIIGKINVSDISELSKHVSDSASLRVAWQTGTNGEDRFRIIPKRYYENGYSPTKSNYDERKYLLPSYYLGLSRLYPVGEIEQDKIAHSNVRLSEDEFRWYAYNYNNILDLQQDIQVLNKVDTRQKQSIGITTENYDYLANSAGEDNLSQILMAILSFKRLKKQYDGKNITWDGGVLLIDEIDATLHPAAKMKLLDFIYNEAKKISIQVIFTTHSLSILKYIQNKVSRKCDCNIIYLTNANDKLEIFVNPNFEMVENDMNISSFFDDIENKQITIYSEDDEARWFLRQLITDYSSRVRIVNYTDGCAKLLSLLENDPNYFQNIMFVLDGDITEESSKNKYITLKRSYANIIKLPGNQRPESVFYDYLLNLDSNHPLLKQNIDKGFTKRKIRNEGPESNKYSQFKEEREKYKHWFNDNLDLFNAINLFEYWKKDNPTEIATFLNEFKKAYRILSGRLHIPNIN